MSPAPIPSFVSRFPPLPEAALPVFERRSLRVEHLPFTVEPAHQHEDLDAAVQIRQAAYERHLPEFSAALVDPEVADFDGVVLLARSKVDGTALGTMRIQTNARGPLPLEASVALPPHLAQARLAEATRLGVVSGSGGSLVKSALVKAFYRYCLAHDIAHMVVAGRSPVDRQYQRLLFQEVFPGQGYIPLRHAGNLPHRVMSLDIAAADRIWREARHPLLDFICHTEHPDIRVAFAARRHRFKP